MAKRKATEEPEKENDLRRRREDLLLRLGAAEGGPQNGPCYLTQGCFWGPNIRLPEEKSTALKGGGSDPPPMHFPAVSGGGVRSPPRS